MENVPFNPLLYEHMFARVNVKVTSAALSKQQT
jgi:hypothetical protein